jgi:hypothetical protein
MIENETTQEATETDQSILLQLVMDPAAFREYEYIIRELPYYALDRPELLNEIRRLCIDSQAIVPLETELNRVKRQIKYLKNTSDSYLRKNLYENVKEIETRILEVQGQNITGGMLVHSICRENAAKKQAKRLRSNKQYYEFLKDMNGGEENG